MSKQITLALALMLGGACASATAVAQTPTATCRANAQAALSAFTHGKFKQTVEHFSSRIAGVATAEKMQTAWTALVAQFGAFQKLGVLTARKVNGQSALVAPLTFANGELAGIIACDGEDRLVAFQFVPPSTLASLEGKADGAKASPMMQLIALTRKHEFKPHEKIEAHVDADGVRVVPIAVESPFGPLPGALTLPAGKGPFPAVVLVQGSGQSDMDETIGANKPFRDIAAGLARAGVASLRYDKRGFVYPDKAAADKHYGVDDEVTDDALAALHLLAKHKSIDPRRVFVLGHSEGAMLVPRIVKRDPTLAGGIMLAAPARPLLTVMQDQTRDVGPKMGLPKVTIDANVKALADEQALLDKADPKHPPTGMFGTIPRFWLWSLHEYHQVAVAQSLSQPLLILQGGSDFQVSPTKDFDQWQRELAGRSDVTFHLFPGLSHLFRTAGKTGTVADYLEVRPTDPQVITLIGTWIKAQPPAGQ